METYSIELKTNFNEFEEYLISKMKAKSKSFYINYEIKSQIQNVKCHMYVFRRYGILAGNYVELNVTLLGCDNEIRVHAIKGTAGDYFLDTIIECVDEYQNEILNLE